MTTRKISVGDQVRFADENGKSVTGRVHSFGQANDGTGRHGVNIASERSVYWRPVSQVRRVQ